MLHSHYMFASRVTFSVRDPHITNSHQNLYPQCHFVWVTTKYGMRNLKKHCYLAATISSLLTNNNSSLEVYDELKKTKYSSCISLAPRWKPLGLNLHLVIIPQETIPHSSGLIMLFSKSPFLFKNSTRVAFHNWWFKIILSLKLASL